MQKPSGSLTSRESNESALRSPARFQLRAIPHPDPLATQRGEQAHASRRSHGRGAGSAIPRVRKTSETPLPYAGAGAGATRRRALRGAIAGTLNATVRRRSGLLSRYAGGSRRDAMPRTLAGPIADSAHSPRSQNEKVAGGRRPVYRLRVHREFLEHRVGRCRTSGPEPEHPSRAAHDCRSVGLDNALAMCCPPAIQRRDVALAREAGKAGARCCRPKLQPASWRLAGIHNGLGVGGGGEVAGRCTRVRLHSARPIACAPSDSRGERWWMRRHLTQTIHTGERGRPSVDAADFLARSNAICA